MKKDIVSIIEKEVSPAIQKATALKITDSTTMQVAAGMLTEANTYGDKIRQEKEKITKPLNQALKVERERWKPLETIIDTVVSTLRRKMSAYQTEAMRKANEEAEKIAARVRPGRGNLSSDKALELLSTIEKPEENISLDNGTIKFRTSQKLVIDDEKKLPREYLIPNESAIKEDLRQGKKISGAHLEEEQIPINFR